MPRVDPEQEKQRLKKVYASMEDGELRKVKRDWLRLTEASRETLLAEMKKRELDLEDIAELEAIRIARDAIRAEFARHQLEREEEQRRRLERYLIDVDAAPPITIRRYRDLPEAMIAKSLLESAGIEGFLIDENVVRMDWLWSNAIGRVKLQVREEDADEAARILKEERLAEFEIREGETYRQPRCPKCGSMDITYDGLDRPLSYATVAVGIPIPVKNAGWRCASCKNRWTEEAGAGTV